jgi:polysaccharide export outer membrane protein
MGCSRWVLVLLACTVGAASGCTHFGHKLPPAPEVPFERQKAVLSEYIIESPDLLQIDLLTAVPLPPYKIQPLDVLSVTVTGTLLEEPLGGTFPVDPDGTINLGGRYRTVSVVGLSTDEARAAIQKHLESTLKAPKVTSVAIAVGRGVQLVRGQHLVRPDGIVALGAYGTVQVAGHTVAEAKVLIEEQLSKFLQKPEVIVNVLGYNSKLYYIIFDFGGAGQQVIRMAVTGNDTVLDALSQVNGLPTVSDPKGVWVARSSAPGQPDQILSVDWPALTQRGRSETNYQLLPNDRIFVRAYTLTKIDVAVNRFMNPVERLLGGTLLGTATYRELRFLRDNGGNGSGSGSTP